MMTVFSKRLKQLLWFRGQYVVIGVLFPVDDIHLVVDMLQDVGLLV